MIIDFHTPKGIIRVNSDFITNEELGELSITRNELDKIIADQPRALGAEIDDLKSRMATLESVRQMKYFWDDYFPIVVIIALFLGLLGQFIWKMIYFPEPIPLVVVELTCITGLVVLAIWGEIKH